MSKYLGFLVQQRLLSESPQYFVFFALAKDLDKWIKISRTKDEEKAIQRVLNDARVRSIIRFFGSDQHNSIPNALLISLNNIGSNSITPLPEETLQIPNFIEKRIVPTPTLGQHEKFGIPTITETPPSFLKLAYLDINDTAEATLIDGQHRLKGAAHFNDDVALLVVALLEPTPEERAFQFIVINNKAKKVPSDNVKSIVAEYYDESKLNERLTQSGIRAGIPSILLALNNTNDSPFFHLLDWDENRHGTRIVDLTSVEYSWRSIERILKQFLEDEDTRYDFFTTMWNAVKGTYPTLWGKESDENKLMKKVSLSAINDYLIENTLGVIRAGMLNPNHSDKLLEFFSNSIRKIPSEFWTTPWRILIQDNTNIRTMIIKDMTTVTANIMDEAKWYLNLFLPSELATSDNEGFE